MKLRTVGKLGVILSVILFCIGVGWYSFAQISFAKEGKDVELLEFVPENCVGLLETDNFDFIMNELPQTAYGRQLDEFRRIGLLSTILDQFGQYAATSGVHGMNNLMSQVMVSFHAPVSSDNVVVYFRVNGAGSRLLDKLMTGDEYRPKKEPYRGKDIDIYPMANGQFVAAYAGNGFLVVSHQKRLIEEVIDAQKDHVSFADNLLLSEATRRTKQANYLTLYGRTSSLPLLAEGHNHNWCEFDIHLNSEVFYMSGAMYMPDTCVQRVQACLDSVQPVSEDSVLIVSGQHQVDSCVAAAAAIPTHTLFDECVANLSRDASYIMVADMDKVANAPERYAPYLPLFLKEHVDRFRSFILSVQITKVGNGLSHIFVFTYKD